MVQSFFPDGFPPSGSSNFGPERSINGGNWQKNFAFEGFDPLHPPIEDPVDLILNQPQQMPLIQGMPMESAQFPGDIPVDINGLQARGTLEDPNLQNMFIHQRVRNDPLPTDIHQFAEDPFRAAPFLDARLDPTRPDPLKDAVVAWNAAPNKAQWELQNPQLAAEVRRSVGEVQRPLRSQQDIVRGTRTHLDELRQREEVSWVERMFRGTKEFIWDDFGKHPAMSVAAVVTGVMMYRMLQGTRAGKAVVWGAGLSIGYHFLRDKFGFKPGEKIAQTVGLFSPKGEKAARTFLDTMRRPFVGPEGDRSAVAFYYERLGIRDEAEQTMFVALLQENPQTFFAWYNQTAGGSVNSLPSGVRGALNRNARISSFLEDMTPAEQRKVLLSVSEKMFDYIGRNNPEAAGDPRGYILRKYVTTEHFNSMYGDFKRNAIDTIKTCPKGVQVGCNKMLNEAMAVSRGTQMQIRNGSQVITFLDVMLAEESPEGWNELMNYNGLGADFKETREAIEDTARRGIGVIDRGGHAVLDWMTGRDPNNPDGPAYEGSLPWMYEQGSQLFWSGMDRIGLQPQDFTDWKNSDFRTWYENGKAAGGTTLEFLAKTPVGRVLIGTSEILTDAVKQGVVFTGDALDELAKYVESLATGEVSAPSAQGDIDNRERAPEVNSNRSETRDESNERTPVLGGINDRQPAPSNGDSRTPSPDFDDSREPAPGSIDDRETVTIDGIERDLVTGDAIIRHPVTGRIVTERDPATQEAIIRDPVTDLEFQRLPVPATLTMERDPATGETIARDPVSGIELQRIPASSSQSAREPAPGSTASRTPAGRGSAPRTGVVGGIDTREPAPGSTGSRTPTGLGGVPRSGTPGSIDTREPAPSLDQTRSAVPDVPETPDLNRLPPDVDPTPDLPRSLPPDVDPTPDLPRSLPPDVDPTPVPSGL